MLAFIIASFGTNLAHISTSLNGAIVAPILGLFALGCLFPSTNSMGAIFGCLVGFLFGIWISFGAFIVKPNYSKLSVSTEFCNFSLNSNFNRTFTLRNELKGFRKVYSISYMWYTPLGTLMTILIGLIVSYFTGGVKHKVDESLILYNLFSFKNVKKEKIKVNKSQILEIQVSNVSVETLI